ncbi:unnamed protein product [Mytilus coruscus]|uniref:Uncharacterized protein n=1 Tax=Mytilus coruscus TaxID=42192 RepID=A0A6J8CXF4_MYTCO|nr:unnamed protein product [Mytilus coruscus]
MSDERINTILKDFLQRPVFGSLTRYIKEGDLFNQLHSVIGGAISGKREVFGSSVDGLKTVRIFDTGDIDSLLVPERIRFDKDDELHFQYNSNDQRYLKVQMSDKLRQIIGPNYDSYLNTKYLRDLNGPFYRSNTGTKHHAKQSYYFLDYQLLETSLRKGPEKCAQTTSVPYSDPFYGNAMHSENVNYMVLVLWMVEHQMLHYLLEAHNQQELTWIREILFSGENNGREVLKTSLKANLKTWKTDVQIQFITMMDLLYFKNETFQQLLKDSDTQFHTYFSDDLKCEPHGQLSMDQVPAIKCSGWPRPAEDWVIRKRKWPPSTIIDEVLATGYELVAKSLPSENDPDRYFFMSFSGAEIILCNSLPDALQDAYYILKSGIKSLKKSKAHGCGLKMFYLKTSMLWVAERTDPNAFEKNTPCTNVRLILQDLRDCFRDKTLPSYFLPECNLIGNMKGSDVENTIKLLDLLYADPAVCVYIAVEMEWIYTKNTTPCESFLKIQEPGYFEQFSWNDKIKFAGISMAKADNYPIYDMIDNMSKVATEGFYAPIVDHLFSITNRVSHGYVITRDQLMPLYVFLKCIQGTEMELFNVIDDSMPDGFLSPEDGLLPDNILKQYGDYKPEHSITLNETVPAMFKLRLKIYGNIFHIICLKLYSAVVDTTFQFDNDDAVYIVQFLRRLKEEFSCSSEDIEDILHYLLFFCHYTRLRYHSLETGKQILRSMREFCENGRFLMTLYFSPKEMFPKPVISEINVVEMLQKLFC